MKESEVVTIVLRTLPKCYKPKKCVVEEFHDMSKYNLDKLYGSLSAIEILEFSDQHNERRKKHLKLPRRLKMKLNQAMSMTWMKSKQTL